MSITQDHIQALAEALGLPELALDGEGSCTLAFDDDLFVYLEAPADSPFVALHSAPFVLAGDPPDELYEALLARNAARDEFPLTLGWDGENGLVCACLRHESAVLDVPGFVALYEGFLAAVRRVRDDLLEQSNQWGAAASPEQSETESYIPMHRV